MVTAALTGMVKGWPSGDWMVMAVALTGIVSGWPSGDWMVTAVALTGIVSGWPLGDWMVMAAALMVCGWGPPLPAVGSSGFSFVSDGRMTFQSMTTAATTASTSRTPRTIASSDSSSARKTTATSVITHKASNATPVMSSSQNTSQANIEVGCVPPGPIAALNLARLDGGVCGRTITSTSSAAA